MADIRVKILVFQHDGTVVSQYLLGEGVHIIGRDPNSAIYAESEYISNEHAKLHLTDEGIFIEDLNSTAGTFLDDVTVRGKLRLNPDQRLKVGDLYIDLQLEAAGDLAPGVKIGAGRYQLVKELGRGAMGQVWLGQDTQLDEHVAIKVLNSDVAKDAVSLLDLKREVQKSRKLSHDNIIRIHDLVQLPGENPFISLEYVEGTDLHAIQLNQPDRIFQWAEVKPYVLQLCEALDYAHERKIVHRDLKPPNIMIAKDGVLKLADFGIAASITDATGRSSMANIISGTPQFMSPQQMLGKSPKASDDIYALGATIYDLLTGRPPFHTGDIAQQVHHVTPAPIEQRLAEFGLQNSVPDYVNSVVLSCLAKDPEVRPSSAGAIAEWIRTEGKSDSPAKRKKTKTGVEKITPEEPAQPEAESAAQVEAQPQPAKDKKSPVLAIAAVAVIAVILGVLFLGKSGDQNENQNQGDGPQAGGKGGTEGQPATAAQMQAKLKEGLVAYYPFNGNAKDESGNGNDGEAKGATLAVDRHGKENKAYEFDGVATISTPQNNFPKGDSPRTVSVWFLAPKQQTHTPISVLWGAGKENIGGKTTAISIWASSGISIDTWGNPIAVKLPNAINNSRWNNFIWSYSEGIGKSYLNGSLIEEKERVIDTKYDFSVIGGNSYNNKERFTGKIDDLRIYDRALSAEEVSALYDLEKPKTDLKKGLVAYYPFNGNARDESGNGNDGEVKRAVLAKDRHGKEAMAYRFKRSEEANHIEIPNPTDLHESKAKTISGWIQVPNTGYGGGELIRNYSDNALGESGWRFVASGDGKPGPLTISMYRKIRSPHVIQPYKFQEESWHHLVTTDNDNEIKLYVNGHELASQQVSAPTTTQPNNRPLLIGGWMDPNQSKGNFNGHIDDVRIYDRALSAEEITALYDLEKPKTDLKKGLIAYYPFNGNAKDESGNGNDGEVKGATSTTDRNGKENSAYSFDGVDDFITTGGDGTSLALSERITISAWFASTDDDGWIISRTSDTEGAHQNYILSIHNQTTAFWLNGLEMDDFRLDGNLDLRDGKWHQLVATWEKNGGVNNTKIYVDGSIDNSKTSPIDSLTTPIWKVQIGGGIEALPRNFLKGSIDDIRIYNRALSADEITALYDLEKPITKKINKPQPPKFTPNSPLAKAAIEAAIRKAAGKPSGALTNADLEKVKRLELAYKDITDLTPLKGLVNLDILLLDHNKVTDLMPLASLKKLTQLKVDFNKVEDLTPLSGMRQLEHAWLHDNQITDLTPLIGMTALQRVYLQGNKNLTKTEIDKLQKALPNCYIEKQ